MDASVATVLVIRRLRSVFVVVKWAGFVGVFAQHSVQEVSLCLVHGLSEGVAPAKLDELARQVGEGGVRGTQALEGKPEEDLVKHADSSANIRPGMGGGAQIRREDG